jgi:hypothetical protein
MDYAVGGDDIGLDDVGVVDLHAAARVDRHALPLDRLCARQLDDFRGHHGAGNDMVGEHLRELGSVGEERLQGARRQLGEGLVRGREDRERPWALEDLDETGRRQGLGQGVEITRLDGGGDDVLGRLRGLCRTGGPYEQGHGAEGEDNTGEGNAHGKPPRLFMSYIVYRHEDARQAPTDSFHIPVWVTMW